MTDKVKSVNRNSDIEILIQVGLFFVTISISLEQYRPKMSIIKKEQGIASAGDLHTK